MNTLGIQLPRDTLEAQAAGIHFENSAHDYGLVGINLPSNRLVRTLDASVSEAAATGRKSSKRPALHAPVGFLSQFAPVNGIDHPVYAHEEFSLWVLRVDTLGYRHYSDAGEG